MPTSTTAQGDRRGVRGDAGFTLLEIALVVLIIGIVVTLTVPRLRDRGRAEMLSRAHRLELTFRLLRSEAVLNGYAYRLNYDIDQQRYWVSPHEQSSVDLAQFAADIGKLARGEQMEGDVLLTDVALPTTIGKVAQGQIFTVFYPDGSVDPTVIHLATPRETYTLWFEPMHARLTGREGYFDPAYAG